VLQFPLYTVLLKEVIFVWLTVQMDCFQIMLLVPVFRIAQMVPMLTIKPIHVRPTALLNL